MGVVYLGVREDGQFRQRVAIKVLKRGMDTEEILRRFELERQLLAALNHPNIARLYDAGSTDDGLPYFAMEFVEGMPLNRYCDRNHLSIEERLNLFLTICSAVQYAHRNLIVHRDIKPDNIIVNSDGIPKLLDFGIAKIINPELLHMSGDPTAPELRIMTPEYASPEQILGEQITTTSDVYSLGVLLYELMTGHRPYQMKERVRAEIERVILEEEPDRPSTAFSREEDIPTDSSTRMRTGKVTTHIDASSVSESRECHPGQLRRRLSGDIDNIVMMAMRKEPQHRYPLVETLSEDIRRHLNGLPITARRASIGYVVQKFVQRHRAGVTVAAMVVIVATLGLFSGWQTLAVEAADARAETLEVTVNAEKKRVATAEKRVIQRAEDVKSLVTFLIVDVQTEIERLMGAVEARRLISEKSVEFLDKYLKENPDDPELLLQTAAGYMSAGQVFYSFRNPGLGNLSQALDFHQKAEPYCLHYLKQRPNDLRGIRQLVRNHTYIGDIYSRQNEFSKARDQYEEALKLTRQLLDDDPRNPTKRRSYGNALLNVGAAYKRLEKPALARRAYEESVEIREELVKENPEDDKNRRDLSVGYNRLGGVYDILDEPDKMAEFYGKALGIREKTLEAHPLQNRELRDVSVNHLLLGEGYLRYGDLDKASRHLRQHFAMAEDLARMSPLDSRAQRDANLAYDYIGALYEQTGNTEQTLADYERYGNLFQHRLNADPENPEHQRRVDLNKNNIAKVKLDMEQSTD